jgi:hypothetical protein
LRERDGVRTHDEREAAHDEREAALDEREAALIGRESKVLVETLQLRISDRLASEKVSGFIPARESGSRS